MDKPITMQMEEFTKDLEGVLTKHQIIPPFLMAMMLQNTTNSIQVLANNVAEQQKQEYLNNMEGD